MFGVPGLFQADDLGLEKSDALLDLMKGEIVQVLPDLMRRAPAGRRAKNPFVIDVHVRLSQSRLKDFQSYTRASLSQSEPLPPRRGRKHHFKANTVSCPPNAV
ncbi:protein of unknown function [Methylocella tundrae]|uniref:Uncharacterized protein n=1 Tax=Methylocella tundrae TaxID=227605 RepID=A0A4U8Z5X1_METTU|nr:protein of unknown function [Methylocella tundrae]